MGVFRRDVGGFFTRCISEGSAWRPVRKWGCRAQQRIHCRRVGLAHLYVVVLDFSVSVCTWAADGSHEGQLRGTCLRLLFETEGTWAMSKGSISNLIMVVIMVVGDKADWTRGSRSLKLVQRSAPRKGTKAHKRQLS
jgi:hypothetical protein